MNDIGAVLLGMAVRGTAFALLGMALYGTLRRRGPAAGSLVALATLLILAGVSVLTLGGAPGWWTIPATPAPAQPRPVPATAASPMGPERAAARPPATAPPAGRLKAKDLQEFTALTAFWTALQAPPDEPPTPRWTWRAWYGAVVLVAIAAGLVRLAIGLRAVGLLRGQSMPVTEPAMLALVEALRAELGITAPVAVRESAALTTPATVGWCRPLVLLPPGWRTWTDREARVVLAHELAHVARGDYLSGVIAHASVALHFYHPLAHWFLSRMRLQQELAADDWGARLAGGSPVYLATLAEMALRQADRPLRWPARAFLPARGTLMKRIEMLRDHKPHRQPAASPAFRTATCAILAALGLAVAGYRGAEAPRAAHAQPASEPAAGRADHMPYDLTFVPAATDILVAVRPAEITAEPALRPLVDVIKNLHDARLAFDLPLDDLEQVVMVWLRSTPARGRGPSSGVGRPSAIILRAAKPRDWSAVVTQFLGESEPVELDGRACRRSLRGSERFCTLAADDRTVIFATETDLRFLIQTSGRPARHAWDEAWSRSGTGQVTVAFGSASLGARIERQMGDSNTPSGVKLNAFAPLWSQTRGYVIDIDLRKRLAIDVAAACSTNDGVEHVERTAQALVTLLDNVMQGFRRQIGQAPRDAVEKMEWVADTLEPLLANLRWERNALVLHARTSAAMDLDAFGKTFVPYAKSASVNARLTQSTNNLKQLGIAMHAYHLNHGKFPPAVVIGPDGKTPHSWRVALLPYLEQQQLFRRYRLDEPWDSPNNRTLIDEMPGVYRSGADDQGHFPAYFALVGPQTPLGTTGGVKLSEITDGASNTVLVVEAKRDIPWTKPEDIPLEPDQPFPEIGGFTPGGFNALYADGAVRYLQTKLKERVLRSLCTHAGHDPLSRDDF